MPKKSKEIKEIRIPVGELKTGFGNPRKIKKSKKDELRKSLDMFGNFGIFVIDEDYNLIAGNQRAALLAEDDPDQEVLCKQLIGYTEAELKAINIKDNTHSGEWDLDILADWTADLTIDLGLEELTEKPADQRKIKEMELIHYEKYDYVMLVCKTEIDYKELQERLGLQGAKVKITNKRSINGRAVWYDKVKDRLFGDDFMVRD